MGTPEEMINVVRAALAPGADTATKQQAAGILRALLAAIEATPGAPIMPASASAPSVPSAADLFGALVEKLRPYLPNDGAAPTVARLQIPLVPIGKP